MGEANAHKAALRLEMRRRTARLGPEGRAEASRTICGRLTGALGDRSSSTVLVFSPLDDEPDVLDAVALWRARGVAIAAPRVDWSARSMEAWIVTSMAEGLFGGLERSGPVLQATTDLRRVAADELGVVLTPGVAFDAQGGRLGRGGGFYDRFLPRCTRAVRVGVAFDHQIVPETPMMDHDAPMDLIVTERRVIEPEGPPR